MIETCPMIVKIYICVVAGVLGAIFGSFMNCMAYRMLHGETVMKGRSHCTSCGHTLGVLDLVPVFSWLYLRGKCRYCKQKISIRYVAAEVAMAILSVLSVLRFDVSFAWLRIFAFSCCLLCLTLTDLEDYYIPDGCLIAAVTIWGVFWPIMQYPLKTALLELGAAVVYGGVIILMVLLFDKILGKESMGGGDIKLLAVCALYLGFVGFLFALILACVIGLIFAFTTKYRNSNADKQFPFGPAIAAACFLMLLYGEPLIQWYLGTLWGG